MERHILILKMGSTFPMVADELGDYESWFQREFQEVVPQDVSVRVHDITGGELPAETPAAIITTGSLSSIREALPWMEKASTYLRTMIDQGVPVLGVCFGHQLIAQALGGRAGKNPRGWELGTSTVTLTPEGEADPLFAGIALSFDIQQSHEDVVLEPPPGAVVLARSPIDPNHAFRIAERVWTVQFHPEMRDMEAGAVLATRARHFHTEGVDRGLFPGQFVMESIASLKETDAGPRILRRFVQLALNETT